MDVITKQFIIEEAIPSVRKTVPELLKRIEELEGVVQELNILVKKVTVMGIRAASSVGQTSKKETKPGK